MTIKKIEKKLKKTPYVPANEDPILELKQLVKQHVALTRSQQALLSMSSDRVARQDLVDEKTGKVIRKEGDIIQCNLPVDVQHAIKAQAEAMKKSAGQLELAMKRELKKVPLWQVFLSRVPGCGPVTSSYIVTMVDFNICIKPSALVKYAGFGVTVGADGKAHRDRPTKGEKLGYNKDLKVRLFQMFQLGVRMAGRRSPVAGRYLKVWDDKKATLMTARGPGTADNKSKGWIDKTARAKATDVFLEDLYIIGRTLAGLPVWPSWYAKAMGYEHGGKVAVIAPKDLTLDEALALVGFATAAQLDEDDAADPEALECDQIAAE